MKLSELDFYEYVASTPSDNESAMFHLDDIEFFADTLFNKIGIDVEFAKHFKSRLKRICYSEEGQDRVRTVDLKDMFDKLFRKYKDQVKNLVNADDPEAVLKDLERTLNIPFKLSYNPDAEIPIELTNKTISSKPDFKTTNDIFAV